MSYARFRIVGLALLALELLVPGGSAAQEWNTGQVDPNGYESSPAWTPLPASVARPLPAVEPAAWQYGASPSDYTTGSTIPSNYQEPAAPPGIPNPPTETVDTQQPVPAAPADGAKSATAPQESKAKVGTDKPTFPNVRLSGFFHLDGAHFVQDEENIDTVGDMQDGVDFRRARLQALGSVAEFTNFSLEMDFAQAGRPSFQDVWLEQAKLPVFGTLRMGQFRQPVSTDSLTPIKQLLFLERSLPFQAFDPFRRVGVMAYTTSEDKNSAFQTSIYSTGGFNNAPIGDARFATDIGDSGGFSVATRATHLLYYDEPTEGRYLLHVGGNLAFSRNRANDYLTDTPFYQARAIPEIFMGDPASIGNVAAATPFFVDTGRIPAESFAIYGVSLLAHYNKTSFQSEYLITTVDQEGGPVLFYSGAYAQVGHFLTGEQRTYNRTFGTFDKVVPHENFFGIDRGICGWGAWEVAGRVSYVDLDDADANPLPSVTPNPGNLVDTTLGLNWYWNAFTKLQFNWIHSWLDSRNFGDSTADTFAARAQLEF